MPGMFRAGGTPPGGARAAPTRDGALRGKYKNRASRSAPRRGQDPALQIKSQIATVCPAAPRAPPGGARAAPTRNGALRGKYKKRACRNAPRRGQDPALQIKSQIATVCPAAPRAPPGGARAAPTRNGALRGKYQNRACRNAPRRGQDPALQTKSQIATVCQAAPTRNGALRGKYKKTRLPDRSCGGVKTPPYK